jgi:hypothetical protein
MREFSNPGMTACHVTLLARGGRVFTRLRQCELCSNKFIRYYGPGAPKNGPSTIYCDDCRPKYMHFRYVANRKEHYTKTLRNMKRNRIRQRILVFEYLKDNPCLDCGNTNPIVLEFHHVRGVKEANVGALITGGRSDKSIFDEIAKCDVVCSNCHKIRTAKIQGWYKGVEQ